MEQLSPEANRSDPWPAFSRRQCIQLIMLFCAAGIACRVAQYLSRQSLWGDEVAVLMNVQRHSPAELPFVPLESYAAASPVAAPPLFLWITQFMGTVCGYGELSDRLLPLLCAVLALPLFAHLCWRICSPRAAVWAVALLAFCDPLLFQCANVKPYSGDVLVAILIVWVAMAPRRLSAGRRLAAATAVAAIGLWLSYVAIFTFVAVAAALWVELSQDGRRGLRRLILGSIPALASFVILYVVSIRTQKTSNLIVQWVSRFPNLSRPMTIPGWLIGLTWDLFRFAFYPLGGVMIFAAAAGVWAMRRRGQRQPMVLLLAPICLAVLAACAGQYPYGGTRVTIFLIPFECLLAGIGAAAISELLPHGWRYLQIAAAVVPVSMIGLAAYQLAIPRNHGDMRDAVHYLQDHRSTGEEIYLVYPDTVEAARWFLPEIDPAIHKQNDVRIPIPLDQFWMVLSYDPRRFSEAAPALRQPGHVVVELKSFHTRGADVLWYERSPQPGG
jgi:hypothetical protein